MKDRCLIQRLWCLFSLCIITPFGFWFKYYNGPGYKWFNDYGAGVLYVVFWCLFFHFFFCRKNYALRIAVWVLTATCFLEVLQLCHAPFLQAIRATYIGVLLIGNTFVWLDLPHYVLGAAMGFFWMNLLWKIGGKRVNQEAGD